MAAPIKQADSITDLVPPESSLGAVHRVCFLLSPFLKQSKSTSAASRFAVLPKAVRDMVRKVALAHGSPCHDFKSKRREYDGSSELPLDLMSEGAIVIDVCSRALDDVFSRRSEFHRMLHMWHAIDNIASICDGPPSGSFAPTHDKGYFFDVVGHCEFMEVFHK